MLERVSDAAASSEHLGSAVAFHLDQMERPERQLLHERHLVSKELAGLERESRPRPGAALLVQDQVGVMVNEEDHLRLHGMWSGFDLEDAYAAVTQRTMRAIDEENVSCRTIMEQGEPEVVIPRVAERGEFDLIVVGSRGHGGPRLLRLPRVPRPVPVALHPHGAPPPARRRAGTDHPPRRTRTLGARVEAGARLVGG